MARKRFTFSLQLITFFVGFFSVEIIEWVGGMDTITTLRNAHMKQLHTFITTSMQHTSLTISNK